MDRWYGVYWCDVLIASFAWKIMAEKFVAEYPNMLLEVRTVSTPQERFTSHT